LSIPMRCTDRSVDDLIDVHFEHPVHQQWNIVDPFRVNAIRLR
jgi:esterase/lipase superfamily enzyme